MSKKSALFKWVSRSLLFVSIEMASILTDTLALLKSDPSLSTDTSNFLNSPFTLVIIRCFTLKVNSLCVGSFDHFVLVTVFSVVSILFCFLKFILQRSGKEQLFSFTYVKK